MCSRSTVDLSTVSVGQNTAHSAEPQRGVVKEDHYNTAFDRASFSRLLSLEGKMDTINCIWQTASILS